MNCGTPGGALLSTAAAFRSRATAITAMTGELRSFIFSGCSRDDCFEFVSLKAPKGHICGLKTRQFKWWATGRTKNYDDDNMRSVMHARQTNVQSNNNIKNFREGHCWGKTILSEQDSLNNEQHFQRLSSRKQFCLPQAAQGRCTRVRLLLTQRVEVWKIEMNIQ